MPESTPAAIVTAAACKKITGSIDRSKKATTGPARYTMRPRSARAAATPRTPPIAAIRTASVSNARTTRPRLAPSDARIAISCSRALRDNQDSDVRTGDEQREQDGCTEQPGQHDSGRSAERCAFDAGYPGRDLTAVRGQVRRVLREPRLQLLLETRRRHVRRPPRDDLERRLGCGGVGCERCPDRPSPSSRTRTAPASRQPPRTAGCQSRSYCRAHRRGRRAGIARSGSSTRPAPRGCRRRSGTSGRGRARRRAPKRNLA